MARKRRPSLEDARARVERLTARLLRTARSLEDARRELRRLERRELREADGSLDKTARNDRALDSHALSTAGRDPTPTLTRILLPFKGPAVERTREGRRALQESLQEADPRELLARLDDVHPTRPGARACPRGACRDPKHHHDERPNADLDAAFGERS